MLSCEEVLRKIVMQVLPDELTSFLDESASGTILFRAIRRAFREVMDLEGTCGLECVLKRTMEMVRRYMPDVEYTVSGNKIIIRNTDAKTMRNDIRLAALYLGALVGALEKAYPEAREKVNVVTPFRKFIHKEALMEVLADIEDGSLVVEVRRVPAMTVSIQAPIRS